MSKESFYFSHDYEPTADPKIQALISEHGAAGYGIYWRIVEMLHSNAEHRLPFKEYIFLAIAKQMSTDVQQVKVLVQQAVDLFELFQSDDDFFWSDRVLKNISKRSEIQQQRSIAGKKSAENRSARSTTVQQPLSTVQQNPTKEKKGKEKKEKEIKGNNTNTGRENAPDLLDEKKSKVFVVPTLEEWRSFWKAEGYCDEKSIQAFKSYDGNHWKDSQGTPIKNWKMKCRQVWFTPKNKIGNEINQRTFGTTRPNPTIKHESEFGTL